MTIGFDDCTPVLTNATDEIQLNGGVSLTTPDKASQIVEVIPYGTYQAAITTDEPQITQIRMQSDDIAIEPIRFCMGSVQPVPALAGWFSVPELSSYPMNIDLAVTRQARINYFARQQLALTNEPAIGLTVVYDTNSPSQPEQYWQKPDNETMTGAAINTRSAGDDITITGGREINKLIVQTVIGTTGTASEHLWGEFEFASSDFLTSLPYRVTVQPIAAGIGVAGDLAIAFQQGKGQNVYNMPLGDGIPIAGRTVINNFFTQRDALAVDGNFIVGVGYVK